MQYPVGARGARLRVRHEYQRCALRPGLRQQRVHDHGGGAGVQIAGGLVGQQQRGSVRQSARYRHPLQLATAELLGQAAPKALESYRFEQFGNPLRMRVTVAAPEQHQGQGDVLRHVQMRQHMKCLKYKAYLVAAQHGPRILVHGANVLAVEADAALVPAVEPGHAVEQCRLAHTRLADDRDEFAAAHLQRHITKDRHAAVALGQCAYHQAHDRPCSIACTSGIARSSRPGASHASTTRCGMERSQVICRLASWRVA